MARFIVAHDDDPEVNIKIISDGETGRHVGFCTACRADVIDEAYSFEDAVEEAGLHIDRHAAGEQQLMNDLDSIGHNVDWRDVDRSSRDVLKEIARLGYDVTATVPADEDGPAAVRLYLGNVGALRLSVVLRVSQQGQIIRVSVGDESMTPRQAALSLRKRAPRAKKYLP